MFIKVKAVREQRNFEITKIDEKIINTDTIAMMMCLTQIVKYDFEDEKTDATEVEFKNGKRLTIIGKVDLDEKSNLIITE